MVSCRLESTLDLLLLMKAIIMLDLETTFVCIPAHFIIIFQSFIMNFIYAYTYV